MLALGMIEGILSMNIGIEAGADYQTSTNSKHAGSCKRLTISLSLTGSVVLQKSAPDESRFTVVPEVSRCCFLTSMERTLRQKLPVVHQLPSQLGRHPHCLPRQGVTRTFRWLGTTMLLFISVAPYVRRRVWLYWTAFELSKHSTRDLHNRCMPRA